MKHYTLDDRLRIQRGLTINLNFTEIGNSIGKNRTSVSREIQAHYRGEGKPARSKCRHRNDCIFKDPSECPAPSCSKRTCSIACSQCARYCDRYEPEICPKLMKPPYVCNGCENRNKCTLSKSIYDASYSQKEYNNTLIESREGISYNEKEINTLNKILKPLIVDKGQSIHNAYINNKDKIMCSEKEIYLLIDNNVLEIKNIDLPRKVRRRLRKKRNTYYKIDKKCLEGRKYEDFLKYIENNKDINIVEMDTVEGVKGGKVLLTLHFVNCSFMLAFIRDNNDSQSVIDIFDMLYEKLGKEMFKKLFQVILTDNGSEFSNPTKIEFDKDGEQRTKIFYCEPSRPDQKGSCEVNHQFIRRIIPKGNSLDDYAQEDVNKMMSHINSYKRKKLNDKSPFVLFSLIYGSNIPQQLGIVEVDPNEVNLSTKLLINFFEFCKIKL